MKLRTSTKLLLLGILLFAASFRLYNINWDQGYHLHPDERAIVLAVVKLQFPTDLQTFLSPDSPWNPHFFAYGSFPMYLLKIVGESLININPLFAQYDGINLVGRIISALSDLVSIIFIFFIGRKLLNSELGLIASFFYAVSVLPIQLSHFYAVDTLLTCFTLITLYLSLSFYEKPTTGKSILIGVFFGLSLATKISALVLFIAIGASLAADFILLFIKQPHKPHIYLPHLPKFIKHLLKYTGIIVVSLTATYLFFEPYALIDFKEFYIQTAQQSAMTHNAFIFPYTLQYVGKIPYLYEAKNILLYGLGPILGTLSFFGFSYFTYIALSKHKHFHLSIEKYDSASRFWTSQKHKNVSGDERSEESRILGTTRKINPWAQEIIILTFVLSYTFVVGRFAIGFMRYMLPVYPLLCLFAALITYRCFNLLKTKTHNRFILNTLYLILYTVLLVWPLSFVHIYGQNNTRVDATNWILQNIPAGQKIAIEHWDDSLPLTGQQQYMMLTLPLYDPDTDMKWQQLNQTLSQTDYIVIASNRLYVPLQKLTSCQSLPPGRCYLRTAEYYKELFAGTMGFHKVAEFSDNPTIPYLNIPLNDQGADESFTVYDHPKIMIFQRAR